MSKIAFNVSSRAARLIGRENVSSASGALIELVKNCHDADATRAIIIFDNKFTQIPEEFTESEFIYHKEQFPEISKLYTQSLILKKGIKKELLEDFSTYLRKYNSIYVIDNGHGMSEKTVIDHWMNIGTDYKQFSPQSPKGRIRSGAKGIGRFALDRLGSECTMFSFDSATNGIEWKVNWEDFERPMQKINEVTAELIKVSNSSLYESVASFNLEISSSKLQEHLDKFISNTGTVLKISGLRDWWTKEDLDKAYSSLDTLIPPDFEKIFEISFFDIFSSDYGDVRSQVAEDFDYKMQVNFESSSDIEFTIYRNELSVSKLPEKIFKLKPFTEAPFRKIDLNKKKIVLRTTLKDLLSNSRIDDTLFERIGPLSFFFIFMKKSDTGDKGYHYRDVDYAKRSLWLNSLGGIKIYRDNFKIRPYGEPGGMSFDWLDLGGRQAKSPAGVTSKGWKVAPYQVSGAVHISRIKNPELEDKSSREGLVENDVFRAFKILIETFIEVFEEDRHLIMKGIKDSLTDKDSSSYASPRNIDKIVKDLKEGKKSSPKKNDLKQLALAYESQKSAIKDLNDENKLLTSLASTGLTISAYAHELLNLQANVLLTTQNLEKRIKENIPHTTSLQAFKDHRVLIKDVVDFNKRVDSWLLLCTQSIKKERRTKIKFNLSSYMDNYSKVWIETFSREAVDFKFFYRAEIPTLRMHQIDLDSILNNLVINSIYAFRQNPKMKFDKKIRLEILVDSKEENLILKYSDEGPGLDSKIKDPRDILKPFFTTRIDKFGAKIGTGLGMWIINKIVDEYKGSIQINKPSKGFSLNLILPLDLIT